MGLYLRKYFRVGPVRLNLSKSGLGLSGGVKGARIGAGPRGTYLHGGRKGLYYRKNLSSGRTGRDSDDDAEGCVTLLVIAVAVLFAIWLLNWLSNHPSVLVAGAVVAVGIPLVAIGIAIGRWTIRFRRKQIIAAYKKVLDAVFVTSEYPPSDSEIALVVQEQQNHPKNDVTQVTLQRIETDVYEAVLDKVLDDGVVTPEEAARIRSAERTLLLSPATCLQIKKDIFSVAYVEAIQDRKITAEELETLRNLVVGLGIPKAEVQHELDIVREIIETQNLRLPLTEIPEHELQGPINKSERAYHQCPAKVLWQQKSKKSPTGYEYVLKRDGMMIVTDKRALVYGNGTTEIRYSDMADLDVDIDDGLIEISKSTSSRTVFIETEKPMYTARIVDLLMNAFVGAA